jgi:hypothetical protein
MSPRALGLRDVQASLTSGAVQLHQTSGALLAVNIASEGQPEDHRSSPFVHTHHRLPEFGAILASDIERSPQRLELISARFELGERLAGFVADRFEPRQRCRFLAGRSRAGEARR